MIFTKMQLNGNDFIFFDNQNINLSLIKNITCQICNRRFGVGADGVILVLPSQEANYKINIYNSDGSKAKVCGNALLLLGKYLYDSQEEAVAPIKEKIITVETDSGVKTIDVENLYSGSEKVTVNMGIPVLINNNLKVNFKNMEYIVNLVDVGNKHGVVIIKDLKEVDIEEFYKVLQKTEYFEDELNLELIEIIDHRHIKIQIFERGVGETLSCGSGACAAVAIAINKNICSENEEIIITSKGGEHIVKRLGRGDFLLTGTPKVVFNGFLRM